MVIRVDNLCKSYQGKPAVDGISFTVEKGECFGLLGPNGAGKTTTIEMMEGIVERDAGRIYYHGSEMTRASLEKIGIQFQHTSIQDYLTSRETLKLFSAFYPRTLDMQTLVSLCQLEDFLDQDHRKLSGGQKQRLLLALALVNDPDILFLDEPTTGLDPHARRMFWTLIHEVKAQGKTIILTTHYMDEAEQLCDHIVVMDKGKIIERGEPKALLGEHFPGVLIRLRAQSLSRSFMDAYGVEQVGDYLELSTRETERTLKDLIEQGVNLEGIQVKSANLDDLFLKLTGGTLRENHA